MSNHLRDDNECQNCGYTVDKAYCSKCGQKNTETRQPFHHLFTHFVEDLTHYDGAFWKTVAHLLLRPARLTREYLIGKRQTYVPPVKLYIFVSFVTFLLLNFTITPDEEQHTAAKEEQVDEMSTDGKNSLQILDKEYQSYEDFEKQQMALPKDERTGTVGRWILRKIFDANERELSDAKILEGFIHTIPKVLFLYMPLFAFWLWLFHGKKRWYFFDHGIFTLHYFSFLLLLCIIYIILHFIFGIILSEDAANFAANTVSTIFTLYAIFYFFRSHSRMYGENRWISRLKGVVLFLINLILVGVAATAAFVYAYINIH